MIINAKTIIRLWGSLMSDFEAVTRRFLTRGDLSFETFCEVAKDMRLSLIMGWMVDHGRSEDEIYDIVGRVIMDAAKLFWFKGTSGSGGEMEERVNMRRRVAGFYLTYFLYMKQPVKGAVGIVIDENDLKSIKEFERDARLFLNDSTDFLKIAFKIAFLKLNNAFVMSPTSNECGIEIWRRTFLTVSKGKHVELSFAKRHSLDNLVFADRDWESSHVIQNWDKQNRLLLNLSSVKRTAMNQDFLDSEEGRKALELLSPFDFSNAASRLEKIANRPVFTVSHLIGDPFIERRMMHEYRKRIDACKKKLLKTPAASTPNRYIQEGSLWDRKLARDEDEQKHPRASRARGVLSQNLHNFLKNLPFGSVPPPTAETNEPVIPTAQIGTLSLPSNSLPKHHNYNLRSKNN